jgi:MYXO-CTERM domain-containing protein
MKVSSKVLLVAAGAACTLAAATRTASACGGFFCNSAQPVNQAAEQIIFSDNGDGTVTAVIQIMYEGPSQSFSWLLPIAGVPDKDEVKVASNLAFQRLQSATNPQYTLTTSVEGTCKQDLRGGASTGGASSGGPSGTGGTSGSGSIDNGNHGVTVETKVAAGAYEGVVISLDASLDDPADAAVTWLKENGYQVPPSAPGLLRPYLEDHLNLLAIKLQKGADTGSIRPLVITYEGTKPSIPIKLTAVAANDDMGVLAWLLSDARGVPQNYYSLELNEALINWFNPAPTYGAVVSAAADDAGGKGFVTEFAGPTSTLANVVWNPSDEATWSAFKNRVYTSFDEIFTTAYYSFQSYDGFWDAAQASVKLPDGVDFASFKLCPTCYSGQVMLDPAEFVAALDEHVVQPLKVVQDLVDAHPELTRLYTTMSADEMTVDPLFTFNADQPDVSNLHTAERIIECSDDYYQFEAPWRIELPAGGVVRGVGQPSQTWPITTDTLPDMPLNQRITQQSNKGEGNLIEDNADKIAESLDAYNESLPAPAQSTGGSGGTGGSSGKGGSSTGATGGTKNAGGTSGGGTGGTTTGTGGVSSGGTGADGTYGGTSAGGSNDSDDSGCSVSPHAKGQGWAWLALGLVAFRRRRRG